MLQPRKVKFRRQQKGRMKGIAHRGHELAFGSFGIKALQSKWITGRQIEAARIAVTRYMQRQGQIWIRIFPDKPITKKPAEVRMGKGKGNPEGYVAPVTPGRIIIECEGVSYEVAKEALLGCGGLRWLVCEFRLCSAMMRFYLAGALYFFGCRIR